MIYICGFSFQVERHEWVEISYQSLTGEHLSARFVGRPAVIFQHEFDHLDQVQ